MKWRNLGKRLKKLINQNQFILYILIFFVAYFAYLWIQATPSFLDPDSFYHLKITKLIAQYKAPVLDFPWLQYTVLKDYYIDHHFLYHVLGIPFIKVLGDFQGFKIYTVILATLFVFLSYAFFKKYKIKYAELFALVLLFSSAFMFRVSLAKASAFSLILLFLGIYCIFKRKYWWLIFVSFFYVWSYGGFLLILGMSIIFILANTIYNTFINKPLWLKLKRFLFDAKLKEYLINFFKNLFALEHFKLIGSSFLGLALGLIINPYFPQNLKFYWQQVIEIGLINYRGLVNVGGEWYPYPFLDLISDSGVVIIFGTVALIFFFIFIKKQKAESFFFLLTTLIFFILTLKSQRYVEYFIPHLAFFAAFTFSFILENIKIKEFLKKFKKESYILGALTQFILIYVAIIFPFIMIKDIYITRQSFKGGISFERFIGFSNYLKENSNAGEIVMQTDWDDFPMLFYYNDQNYYIVGLDPTFMYNYDSDLYNLFADITTAKKTDNLYEAVKDGFGASYFIVDQDRLQLKRNLQNDANFIKVYEDKDGAIFELND